MQLDKTYWNQRYLDFKTGWDIGCISFPLQAYFDQLSNKDLRILIAGCGNAYEAEYLHKNDFVNTYILDFSNTAINNFKKRVNTFPDENIFELNFFDLNQSFDIVIEQTFFCALDIKYRKAYALKMYDLLSSNGKLVGLFFDDVFNNDAPPFGAPKELYLNLLAPYFNILTFEKCYNSIDSRLGNEFFCIAQKK